MGMFDSVMVNCPRCGIENELQTKNGECGLHTYNLINAPPEVILGVEGVHTCDGFNTKGPGCHPRPKGCGEEFEVFVQCITKAWVEVRMQAI